MNEAINFIKYGVNDKFTAKEFRKSTIAISIFNSFGILFGIVYKKLIPLCCIMLIVILFSVIFVFIKTRHRTLKNYFWNSGIMSISSMVESMFCSLVFCEIGNFNTLTKISVIFLPLFLMLLFFLMNFLLIKREVFKNLKKVQHQKIKWYSACGGAFGIAFAHILSTNMSQSNALWVVIICYTILSCLFALGGINFYKIKLLKEMNYDESL